MSRRTAQAAARARAAEPARPAPVATPKTVTISPEALALSRIPADVVRAPLQPFTLPTFPPGVEPAESKLLIAQDEAVSATTTWASNAVTGLNLMDGLAWLGFAQLAELAQRPEYRKIAKTLSEETTRKWIRFQASGSADKSERLRQVEAEFSRLRVREHFKKVAEMDAFMGRHHIYLDFGDASGSVEVQTSIGDGSDAASRNKIARGSLKRVKSVEAVWCYPANYNTTDPLAPDWYCPSTWYVQGRPIHATRLLTFVSCEVPDLLKPSYAFGGVSLSQQAKPYVDNWLRTRQGVSDLIDSFSDKGLKTSLSEALGSGGFEQMMRRAQLFANIRNNRGVMLLDKDEDFFNIETSLGSLDKLQAQAQEQMASVSGIPLVKLLGITPSGLNASSDGEIRVFYDSIHAYQDAVFGPNLNRILNFVQLSLWGEVDPDITYSFNPLWSLDDKEAADVERTKAETDKALIEARVLSREEARGRVAHAKDSAYAGLDPAKVPPPSIAEAADIAVKKATVLLQAGEGGMVPEPEVLRGLRDTGLFPGLTEQDIAAAAARVAEAPDVGELGADAAWRDDDPCASGQ